MTETPGADPAIVAAVERLIADGLAEAGDRPFVLGLCGAQGSGKSTLADALVRRAAARGTAAVALSLDDLYLPAADRAALAARVHPLFRARGVPGTHDVALGLHLLDDLAIGRAVAVPRFDKATDDRAPQIDWPVAPDEVRLVILEGWCVGAVAQDPAALVAPVNALERDEDDAGRWRTAVNAALAVSYPSLFARLDRLVLLAAPSFDVVLGWRTEQEHRLIEVTGCGMDDATLGRFVQHYERLTRHILAEMPARADLVIPLDDHRRPIGSTLRTGEETTIV